MHCLASRFRSLALAVVDRFGASAVVVAPFSGAGVAGVLLWAGVEDSGVHVHGLGCG